MTRRPHRSTWPLASWAIYIKTGEAYVLHTICYEREAFEDVRAELEQAGHGVAYMHREGTR